MGSKPTKGLQNVQKDKKKGGNEDEGELELDDEMKKMFAGREDFKKLAEVGEKKLKEQDEKNYGKFVEESGEDEEEEEDEKKTTLNKTETHEKMEKMDVVVDNWREKIPKDVRMKLSKEEEEKEIERMKKEAEEERERLKKEEEEERKKRETVVTIEEKKKSERGTPKKIQKKDEGNLMDNSDESEEENVIEKKRVVKSPLEMDKSHEEIVERPVTSDSEEKEEKKETKREVRSIKTVEKITETIISKEENKATLFCILEANERIFKISMEYPLIISTEIEKLNSRIPHKVSFFTIDSFTPFMLMIFKVVPNNTTLEEFFKEKVFKVESEGGRIENKTVREITIPNIECKTLEISFDLLHNDSKRMLYLIIFITKMGISFMIQHLFEEKDEVLLKTMFRIVNTIKINEL